MLAVYFLQENGDELTFSQTFWSGKNAIAKLGQQIASKRKADNNPGLEAIVFLSDEPSEALDGKPTRVPLFQITGWAGEEPARDEKPSADPQPSPDFGAKETPRQQRRDMDDEIPF